MVTVTYTCVEYVGPQPCFLVPGLKSRNKMRMKILYRKRIPLLFYLTMISIRLNFYILMSFIH
jgi:hypothetical protein